MFLNFNSNKMNFILILFFSTLISISSNSWLGCWIGLEINLLSFIPIISNTKNLLTSEASLKYFLVQAIASANLLFIIMLNLMNIKMYFINNLLSILINSSLLMKMGTAPFHYWFPNIMEGLSWMNCFLLMTWQKITPMILLSYYYNFNFLIMIIMITAFTGAIGGLNQTSLRKLLAFSSINHLGWMISALIINYNTWNLYFMIYFIMMFMMCMFFFMMNTFYLNQLFYFKMNNLVKFFILMNLLSLGGLPPFLGFLPKWIIINFLIENKFYFLTFILIMTTLITLFFYIRISYSALMINYLKLKWTKIFIKNILMKYTSIMSFISLNTLIISTYIFYII